MLKFLIQADKKSKQVIHEFSFALLESIDYQRWKGNHIIYRLYYDSLDAIQSKKLADWIPIGSVEFVMFHVKHFHGKTPLPFNVPDELVPFAGRKIFNGTKVDVSRWINEGSGCFVKSRERIKHFAEIIETPNDLSYVEDDHAYQISSLIDILSEWRVFVFLGEVVGIKHYSGNFFVYPDSQAILQMVKAWTSAPKAYTLDVAITHSGTCVIECHDFFSCGFYGFCDKARIPYMFAYWFNSVKNN